MIEFSQDPVVSRALEQWRSRRNFPTDFSSMDLRGFSRQLRERSVFSARMTYADAVQQLADVVDDMLSGKIGQGEGRYRMMRFLKECGYDPATGFPQDMADVPPAEKDSLQDLSSAGRIDLMLETNQRMAANFGMMQAGNGDYARYAYPAWELVRIYHRDHPRGTPESKSPGWEQRWHDAGEAVDWEGAIESPMIALKDSPIWQALGDGDGGYNDTLGNPYPPFAFRSGKGWRPVPRKEADALGLLSSPTAKPAPSEATFSPGEREIAEAIDRLSPDLRAALERELKDV